MSLSFEASGTGILEKPLLLFSGDVFSPSVESTVTRGSHMVPVVEYLWSRRSSDWFVD